MRLNRDGVHDLLVKRDSTGCPAHRCQHLVIIPFTPAKPAAMQVKSYTRYQNQVQPVRRNGNAVPARLANPELATANVPGHIGDFTGYVPPSGCIEAGQGGRFALPQENL